MFIVNHSQSVGASCYKIDSDKSFVYYYIKVWAPAAIYSDESFVYYYIKVLKYITLSLYVL